MSKSNYIFVSTIQYYKGLLIEKIFIPFFYIKKTGDRLFEWVFQSLWDELLHGQNDYDSLSNLLMFLLVATTAIVLNLFNDLDDWLLLVSLCVWIIDYLQTHIRIYFFINEYFIKIIDKQNDFIIIQIESKGEILHEQSVNKNEILALNIDKNWLIGGIFKHKIIPSWNLTLNLKDKTSILVSQKTSSHDIWSEAKKLAKSLDLQITFKNLKCMQTKNNSITRPVLQQFTTSIGYLNPHPKKLNKIISSERKILIFFMKVLKESGLFLFIVVLFGILKKFGALLYFYLAPYFAQKATLHIELTLNGIINLFKPDISKIDLLELIIGLVIIFIISLKYKKYVVEIKDSIISNKKGIKTFKKINSSDIEMIGLYTKDEDTEIFIVDDKKIYEVGPFIDEESSINFYKSLITN